jgi:hypothetical protein
VDEGVWAPAARQCTIGRRLEKCRQCIADCRQALRLRAVRENLAFEEFGLIRRVEGHVVCREQRHDSQPVLVTSAAAAADHVTRHSREGFVER